MMVASLRVELDEAKRSLSVVNDDRKGFVFRDAMLSMRDVLKLHDVVVVD